MATPTILWSITALLFTFYAYHIIDAVLGVSKINCQNVERGLNAIKEKTTISVVVALRNEADNVAKLIAQLRLQNFSPEQFEVIFVNDHSIDTTFEKLTAGTQLLSNFYVYTLERNENGKKAAIRHGVSKAKGTLIITTDADCTFSPNWIDAFHKSYIENNSPMLLLGTVDIEKPNNLFDNFQRLEFLAMVFTGLGKAKRKHAVLGNAANMGFRKELFNNETILKQEVSSGDDVFLVHFVKKYFPEKIAVCTSPDACVFTPAQKNLKSFIQQRLRWGGKATLYKDRETISLTLTVFLYNCSLCIGGGISLFSGFYYFIPVWFVIKTLLDSLLFQQVNKTTKEPVEIWQVLLFQFIYPFYITTFGIASAILPYRWKGRKGN